MHPGSCGTLTSCTLEAVLGADRPMPVGAGGTLSQPSRQSGPSCQVHASFQALKPQPAGKSSEGSAASAVVSSAQFETEQFVWRHGHIRP